MPCPAGPFPAVLLHRSCPQLTCPHSLLLSVLSWLTCLGWPVQLTWLGSPNLSCPVIAHTLLSWLSCRGCPIWVVLSQLHCPSVMFWTFCPFFLVLPVPAGLSYPAALPRLSCTSCPASAFLSTALLPPLSCLCCHVFIVLSYLYCPPCFVLFIDVIIWWNLMTFLLTLTSPFTFSIGWMITLYFSWKVMHSMHHPLPISEVLTKF